MDTLTAKPGLLKQVNLSLIRKVLKTKQTATKAEIAVETKISSTTIRSLLTEMIEKGEIESIGHDKSSGGRKAERYRFKSDRYYSAVLCMTDNKLHGLLVNISGEIVEITDLDISGGDFEQAMISYLDNLILQKEIKSIGIGVPGIVEGGCFRVKDMLTDGFIKYSTGEKLAAKYQIPVIMENDLNATTLGFGRCYQKEFPSEKPDDLNMAYLYFEKNCVSAGFISGGRIIRGCHNFAGELGLVPIEENKLLDELIGDPMDDLRYTQLVIRIAGWVCGILNPSYIALGGPDLRKNCIGPIGDGLSAYLPQDMLAEILDAGDTWHDYHDGMASLAAAKMFDEVEFRQN